MTRADLLRFAAENLWRMKLRASLTVGGVMIAIGAFVAMLSFSSGARERVSEEFEELGLLHTMQVYPADSLLLDEKALETLSSLPGVRLAYPFEEFRASVAFADTTRFLGPGRLAHTTIRLVSRRRAVAQRVGVGGRLRRRVGQHSAQNRM